MHNWIHKGKEGGLHLFQCTECGKEIKPFRDLGKHPQERIRALDQITIPCKQENEGHTPQDKNRWKTEKSK